VARDARARADDAKDRRGDRGDGDHDAKARVIVK
jgi:hypothetical protein